MPRTSPKSNSSADTPAKTALPRGAKTRIKPILALLEEHYPNPRCELNHENPLQLLIATILSAQCTDVRVNMVTPALFAAFPTAADLAAATQEDVEELVKTTGFFRNKAKNIRATAQRIVTEYGGEVPQTMEALLTLPGVARKTANVVLGTCFGIPSGVVVDTHVTRLSNLLGLTTSQDAVRIERDLQQLVPKSRWIAFSHQLILHGRAICIARRPKCSACPLAPHCPGKVEGSAAGTVRDSDEVADDSAL